MHRDGYGFLIPDRPIEGITGDIFLPPASAAKGHARRPRLVRIARIEADGRADGEILKVLKRAHPTVVGEFRVGRRGNFVVPHDDRIRQWIEIPEGMEIPPAGPPVDRIGVAAPQVSSAAELDGMIVNVEILEYPEDGERAVGRVIEILGHPDDFGVDVEIVIRKHHLPHRFPPEVVEQAAGHPRTPSPPRELAGRRDFRALDIVTIDGETARDFDDAVWVDRLPNGNYALHVHIADVSHYVRPGTPIDVEAAPARHQRLLPRPRRAHAAPRALHRNLLARTRRWTAWCSPRCSKSTTTATSSPRSSPAASSAAPSGMTYTDVHLLLEGDAALRERYRPPGRALRADARAGPRSSTASASGAAPSTSTCPSRSSSSTSGAR